MSHDNELADIVLRKSGKLDLQTYIRLAHAFCHGFSIPVAAKSTGVSEKTARDIYLAVRERLRRPPFQRWHGINAVIPKLRDGDQELVVKATFFDLSAECHFDKTCHRNYELGNRKTRIFRKCPLHGKFPNVESMEEAVALSDTVRDFYRRLKIRIEKDRDPVSLFRLRLMHMTVVGTARNNSRRTKDGLLDPLEKSFLSFGTLLNTLIDDLLAEPL